MYCVGIPCGKPESRPHLAAFGELYQYPHAVNFSCPTGFTLHGNQKLTCQSNGSWSSAAPWCEPVKCTQLSEPPYGRLSSSNRTFTSIVHVWCQSGYEVKDNVTALTCLDTGLWDSQVPKCIAVHCHGLKLGAHTRILKSNTSFQGSVEMACTTGYIYSNGSASRVCMANRQWTGATLQCLGK